MKAVFSVRPFARLASMNSTVALYSRGRSIVAGTVLLSTVASCMDGFLLGNGNTQPNTVALNS